MLDWPDLLQGCTDYLAHMRVHEKQLTAEGASPPASAPARFDPCNEAVLESLSAEFQGYLRGSRPWFEYLGRFRQALEYHDPLYVPANTVTDDTLKEIARLGKRIGDATLDGDTEAADRLTR